MAQRSSTENGAFTARQAPELSHADLTAEGEAAPPSVAGTAFVSLLDQGIVSLASVVTGIIVGRTCGKSEYGLYVLGFSVVVFAINIQNALIATPYMVRYPALGERQRRRYTGSTVLQELALALACACCVAVAALGAYVLGRVTRLPLVLAVLAAALPVLLLRDFARRVLFAQIRMQAALAMDGMCALLAVGVLLALSAGGRLSSASAFVAMAVTWAVPVAWVVARLPVNLRVSRGEVVTDCKDHWRFGRWVFLGALLGSVSQVFSPWALAAVRGTTASGTWGACASVAAACNPLLLGIQNFLGPRIAHAYAGKDPDRLGRTVYRWAGLFGGVIALVAVPIGLAGGFLVAFLYGDEFAGHGAVVAALMAGLVALGVGFVFSRGLYVLEKPQLDSGVNGIGLVLFVGMGLPLMSLWGAFGAALAFLCMHVVCALLRACAFAAKLKSARESGP